MLALIGDVVVVGVVRAVAAGKRWIGVREHAEWIAVPGNRPDVQQVLRRRDPIPFLLGASVLRDASVEAERFLRPIRSTHETDAGVIVPVVVRARETFR